MGKKVLVMKEAMEYLRTTRPTILKLIKEGKIKATKVGRNYRFLEDELDKFLRGETGEPRVATR
ncbi:MAG: DNA-binding protein [Euryarchaeota archaeon]|nr:DNA-binding protein [Euryarchaeota archaeon]